MKMSVWQFGYLPSVDEVVGGGRERSVSSHLQVITHLLYSE